MSKKFCPLGFFSFYVNKSEAQAGACHHCVEDNCALWNEEYEECSLKVGLDSLSALAENFNAGHKLSLPERRIEVEAPKLSIFDKLRRKTEGQKLPTVEAATQVANSVESSIPQVSAPPSTLLTPPSPPPPPPPAPITIQPTNELLKPPDVPLETLPIISITSKEN